MSVPVILAHGALGIWDEVIFLSLAAIFLVMMGISWFRSRAATPEDDIPAPDHATEPQSTDRFQLD
ncbi:MAG: hypothetical protein JNJ61_09455 [Anaerolineae bacterium]|nr:hypothetical protein [Anaerolineae bacterium]